MKRIKKELSIEGMRCVHCAKHTEEALKAVKGVKKVEVSLEDKLAIIEMNENVSLDALTNAVESVGFKVVEIK